MIRTAATALMIGRYDWHEQAAPAAMFARRLDRVWKEAAEGDEILLIHGDRAEFSMLAWLTHFTPKLGSALALFRRDDRPELLFSGGGGMAESARRLTWIEAVRALSEPERDLVGLAGRRVCLLGAAALSHRMHRAILAAIGPRGRLRLIDDAVLPWRRRKEAGEIVHLRTAARALGAFWAAAREQGPTAVAALRAAYAAGAHEVRIAAHPAGTHVAVRAGLYWAQGWQGGGDPATLARAGEAARAGAVLSVPEGGYVGGIGLSLCEPPGPGAPLAVGDVLSLRLAGGSAMLLVGEGGPEWLWRSAPG